MGENCTGQLLGSRKIGKELAKGSIVESKPRKCLADISNLPTSSHESKLQGYSPKTKEYIHKLQQEIVSLMKLLADKTKIVQLHELEIQKLSAMCQQLQLKNQQFAKTNSQMLGELNSAKDKLKVLQHELGCKNGLLAARNLESEVDPINCDEVRKAYRADKKTNVPCKKKRKRQSKSLDNNSSKPVQVQEKIDERRQSIRLKNVEQVPTENVLETSDSPFTEKSTQNNNKVDEQSRLSRSICNQPTATVERIDTLALAEDIIDKEIKCKNKFDDKRKHLRRQSTRYKAEEEERTAMVESNDTLDLTVSKPVQVEIKTDDKRQHSRRQSTRYKVEEESTAIVENSDTLDLTTSQPVQVEMNTDDKRPCSRRRSPRFKQQDQLQEPTKDLSHIDNVEVHASPLNECGSTSSASSARFKFETPECELRTSRPKRQATEKVQSYKEIPLNIKMRRYE